MAWRLGTRSCLRSGVAGVGGDVVAAEVAVGVGVDAVGVGDAVVVAVEVGLAVRNGVWDSVGVAVGESDGVARAVGNGIGRMGGAGSSAIGTGGGVGRDRGWPRWSLGSVGLW